MSAPKPIANPFPGLRPFETDEYRLFFGREGQSDALIERLQRARFLAVVGTSGSGKSSLVRAGLLPALRGGMMAGAGAGWRVAVMRPGHDPIGNLARELTAEGVLAELGAGLARAEAEAFVEATLRRGSLGLVDAVRQARIGANEKLLVVVDQFEELFRFRTARMATDTDDDASAFVKLMLEARQADKPPEERMPIYVVLTMRSDFLGDCAQFQGLPEAINDGQYLIPRMTRDERRFAITGPVRVARGKITEPLVNRLLNDVGDNPDQLPILQHALMRTWDYWKRTRGDGEPIGIEHYEAVGTMSDALSLHADKAFDELPDERSRRVAEVLFKALTERGADNREIRRPTTLSVICRIADASEREVVAVIEIFRREGRSFLMPAAGEPVTSETVIDISHESLIRNWERLKAWVKDEADAARIYRRLAEAAMAYRTGEGGLLDEVTLQWVQKWRDKYAPTQAWGVRYHPEFDAAIAYLEESRAAHEAAVAERECKQQEELERARREREQAEIYAAEQARAAQRLRRFTFALVLISLLALAGAGGAAYAFTVAKQNESLARKEQKNAVDAKTFAETLTLRLQAKREELEEKTQELQASVDAFKKSEKGRLEQTALAEQRALTAQKATTAANIERKRAQSEAARALRLAKVADDARKQAEANAAQSKEAVERGTLIRKGLEALQRENYTDAQEHFEELASKLESLQPGAVRPPEGQRSLTPEQAAVEMGWARSNKATAYWKADELGKAEQQYDEALGNLERYLVDKQDPILYDTYHGLGHVYHAIASQGAITNDYGEDVKIDAKQFFNRAEYYFKKALDFQKGLMAGEPKAIEPEEVAAGHTNLARLYRDMGNIDEAEKNFVEAVKLRKKRTSSDEITTALKELAEFYWGQNRLDAAARAYNELIDFQENSYSLERGRDIADSYSALGQIYNAQGKEAEADGVFEVANLLQQAVLKRQKEEDAIEEETTAVTLDDDLDELGDAYIKIGRYKQAEQAYLAALEDIRLKVKANDGKRRQSYEKLGDLYYKQIKDNAKAKDYYYMLVGFYETNPKRFPTKYPEALVKLGRLYATDPSTFEGSEKRLTEALAALKEKPYWLLEDSALSALTDLYARWNKEQKLEETNAHRLTMLNKYYEEFTTRLKRSPDEAFFMRLYVRSVGQIADFYLSRKRNAQADAAYSQLVVAAPAIIANTFDAAQLNDYASKLENYQSLLRDMGRTSDASNVEQLVKSMRVRQYDLQEIRKQQQSQQGPPPESIPTPQ